MKLLTLVRSLGRSTPFLATLFLVLIIVGCSSPSASHAVPGIAGDVSPAGNGEHNGPEQVVGAYLAASNYTTLPEFSASYAHRQMLSTGYAQEVDVFWQEWAGNMTDLLTSQEQSCHQASDVFGKDLCQGWADPESSVGRTIAVGLLRTTSRSDTDAAVVANLTVSRKADGRWSTTNETTTYVLVQQNGWRVADIVTAAGPLTTTFNVTAERASARHDLLDLRANLAALSGLVERARAQRALRQAAMLQATTTLGGDAVASITSLDERTGTYTLVVKYSLDPSVFTDDYLYVTKDASATFKAVFPIDAHLQQVELTAMRTSTDDYGNPTTTILAKTTMTRTVYNKINWNSFDTTKLGRITPLAFYGNSAYKHLLDLQASLDTLNAMSATP